MRTTAKLLKEGLDEKIVVDLIVLENLFQYPTEKSIRRMALACIKRLKTMKDEVLIVAIATQPSDVAKQICLYAMMCQYRLVWDFMLTVIGDKYKKLDNSLGKLDLNIFYELTSARQLGCNLERNNYFKNKTSAKKTTYRK